MSDFFGGLVSYGANRIAQERSFEMQKELQGDAQNYNTLMWNKANEYNSPYQQMMRFQSAGLNPNLIYSQMNGGLAAPTMGSGSAPSPAQSPGISMLESAQIGLIDAQRENIEADTESKMSGIELNDATIEKYGHENNWTDQQIEESKASVNRINEEIKSLKLDRVKVKAEIKYLQAQRNLTEWQSVQAMVDAMWSNERNRATIDNICAQTNLTNAQAKEILTLMYAKLANIKSSTALNRAEANTSRALRYLYRSQKEGQDISNTQAIERFDKDMQLLDQSISTGSIQSELSEDFPMTMKFVSVLGQVLGATGPLLGAGIVRGGLTRAGSKTYFPDGRRALFN